MLGLYVQLQGGEYPPCSLGQMTSAIRIVALAAAMVHEVAQRRVVLVHRLATGPVQRLTRVVLVVADARDLGDGRDSVGEIHHHAIEDGQGFAIRVVARQSEVCWLFVCHDVLSP